MRNLTNFPNYYFFQFKYFQLKLDLKKKKILLINIFCYFFSTELAFSGLCVQAGELNCKKMKRNMSTM